MEEPRKIVVILGNGFDLDLGLKTKYQYFWESDFCPKHYPAPLIHHLNQRWQDNLEAVKWYDLENELYIYYKDYVAKGRRKDVIDQNEVDFLKIYKPGLWGFGLYNKHISQAQSLADKEYIIADNNPLKVIDIPYHKDMLESLVWRDREALRLIKEGLCKYLNSIDKPISDNISSAFHLLLALEKTAGAGDFIDIFNFNYTNIHVCDVSLDKIPIHHMHGNCKNGKIIIGTRDDLKMSKEYDFLQKAMDDSFTPPDIITPLKEADEVIIFGHSLGENDRQYFAPFFLKQVDYYNDKPKNLTIFTRDDKSKIEIKRALQKMTDGRLSSLLSIKEPVIIRTTNIQEDQNLMYNFLVAHHTERHYASEVVNKLI